MAIEESINNLEKRKEKLYEVTKVQSKEIKITELEALSHQNDFFLIEYIKECIFSYQLNFKRLSQFEPPTFGRTCPV